MEPKPSAETFVSLEDHVLSVYGMVMSVESDAGSVASLVNKIETAYKSVDENGTMKQNVLQLQRISRAVVMPNHYSENDDDMVNGFYWGSLLGLMVGHYSMQEKWSSHLYHTLDRQYMDCYNDYASSDDGYMQYEPITQDPDFLLNVSDIYLERVDHAEESLPGVYWDMIVRWASELSTSDDQEYYIKAGFVNVISVALAGYEYVYDNDVFDNITAGLDIPWDGV